MIDPIVMAWALLFFAASAAVVVTLWVWARKHPELHPRIHVIRPVRPSRTPRLQATCPHCGGRYLFGRRHPSSQQSGLRFHREFECPATTRQEAA